MRSRAHAFRCCRRLRPGLDFRAAATQYSCTLSVGRVRRKEFGLLLGSFEEKDASCRQTVAPTERLSAGGLLCWLAYRKVLAGCLPASGFSQCSSFHMTTVPSVRSETDRARRTRPRSRTRVAVAPRRRGAQPRPGPGRARRARRGVGAARNDAGGRSPSMSAERRNNQLRQENQPYIKYKVKGRCTLYSIYTPRFSPQSVLSATCPYHQNASTPIGPDQPLLQQNRPTLAQVTAGLARRRPLVAERLQTQQRHCAAAASSGATRARPRHVQAPLPARGGRAQRARSSAPRGR